MAVQTDWSRRDALRDWLTANGIEPNIVPIDGDLTIVDTEHGRAIRYEAFVQKDGAKVMDPRGGEAYEIRTVLLVTEPPAWWTPYEKPTREQLLTVLERVRRIPRLPHPSQQTGDLGRAYTRGWESVISALDKALDGKGW